MSIQVRVGVEWVNNFHSDACHQNDLSYCDDQVEGFYNHMGTTVTSRCSTGATTMHGKRISATRTSAEFSQLE